MHISKVTIRVVLVALALLVAGTAVEVSAQEIPQPIVRPCKHPCLNKIRFARGLDKLELHAGLVPLTSVDPGFETFAVEISNVNGTVFTATLPPGAILTTNGGNRYTYRNPAARTAGGIYRVVVTQKTDGFRVDLIAYGDLSSATEADMATFIAIGDDGFFDNSTWLAKKNGWAVDFPQ
jgi:hypothetical protein